MRQKVTADGMLVHLDKLQQIAATNAAAALQPRSVFGLLRAGLTDLLLHACPPA